MKMFLWGRLAAIIVAVLGLSVTDVTPAAALPKKQFHIGYLEAGDYIGHNQFRTIFRDELDKLTPQGWELVFEPTGFRSAGWDRESCITMARELAAQSNLDIIITVGPWGVRDLLAAGCKTPILAACQLDPSADSLLDMAGRPVARNLTVTTVPNRLADDLQTMKRLFGVKKLGVLYFQGASDGKRFLDTLTTLAAHEGIDIHSATGFNNFGTFAYFKAYAALTDKIDALYVGPFWGLEGSSAHEFTSVVARNRVPLFCGWESYPVGRGACASSADITPLAEARFQAGKTIKILQGSTPADLPVELPAAHQLTINRSTAALCNVKLADLLAAEANIIEPSADASVPSYTLNEAIARALEQNPGYLARHDALAAATTAASRAMSAYLPHLSVSAGATHVDDNTVSNEQGRVQSDQYRVAFSLEQTLFSLPAIREIQLASRSKDSLTADFARSRLEFIRAVTIAYLNYARAEELLTIRKTQRAAIDRNLQLARARAALGEETESDVMRWQTERLRTTASILEAQANLSAARVLLNVFFNQSGEQLFALAVDPFMADRFLADYDSITAYLDNDASYAKTEKWLVAEAIRTNPSARLEDIQLASRRLDLSLTRSRWLPTFGLGATLALADSMADQAPIFTEKRPTLQLSARLNWNLLDGFDRFKAAKQGTSLYSRQEYLRDNQRLELMGTVQVLLARLRSQLQVAHLQDRAARMADADLDSLVNQYDSGHASFADADRQTTVDAESHVDAILARFELQATAAKLLSELGWELDDHLPSPIAQLSLRLSQQFGQP
ncbi:MAG: ABC transporter substrate binding protein [Candidatus Zixiibacteriota bacterium]